MNAPLVLDRAEVGRRVRVVRVHALGLSGRAFAALLGSTDPALAAKLEQGKSLTRERLGQIAEAAAGEGLLRDTAPQVVLDYLEGRRERLDVYMSYYARGDAGHSKQTADPSG